MVHESKRQIFNFIRKTEMLRSSCSIPRSPSVAISFASTREPIQSSTQSIAKAHGLRLTLRSLCSSTRTLFSSRTRQSSLDLNLLSNSFPYWTIRLAGRPQRSAIHSRRARFHAPHSLLFRYNQHLWNGLLLRAPSTTMRLVLS